MLNTTSITRARENSGVVPKVLLQAKKEAMAQITEKDKSQGKAWNNGPWDDGHWANRR